MPCACTEVAVSVRMRAQRQRAEHDAQSLRQSGASPWEGPRRGRTMHLMPGLELAKMVDRRRLPTAVEVARHLARDWGWRRWRIGHIRRALAGSDAHRDCRPVSE